MWRRLRHERGMSFGDPGVWVSERSAWEPLRFGPGVLSDDEYESIGGRRAIDMEVRRRAAAVHGGDSPAEGRSCAHSHHRHPAIGGAVVVGRSIERAASATAFAAIESAPSAVALSVIW